MRRRRQGTGWQITVAIAGLTILGLALLAGRVHEATMVSTPSAVVGPSQSQANAQATTQQTSQNADQQSAGADAGTQAGAQTGTGTGGADASGSAAGAGSASVSTHAGSGKASASAHGHASASASAVPGVPAVAGVGQTLFNDNFTSDPLGSAVPAGWALAGVTQSSGGLLSGLGGLPLVGGLLGGGTSSVTGLLPQLTTDGTQHVLSHVSNTWTMLTAGSAWVDYSASVDMKTLGSGSGFVGISGRYQDGKNYVACGVRDDSTLQLWQIVNGQSTLLDSKSLNVPAAVFHTVTMTMQGAQMSCSLDGVTLLHGTDTSVGAGKLGLIDLGDVTSEVSSVTASTIP